MSALRCCTETSARVPGEDPRPARVVVDDKGCVLSFSSLAAAMDAAQANGWPVASEEPSAYDIDGIEEWCRSDAGVHDCTGLLNAWNLLVDMPGGKNLFRARARGLYDKLFRGCNLPWMTPPGENYAPVWTASETPHSSTCSFSEWQSSERDSARRPSIGRP